MKGHLSKICILLFFIFESFFCFAQTESEKKLAVSKIVIFNIKPININKSVADAVTQNLIFELNNFTKYGNFEAIEKSKYENFFKSINLNIDDPVELDNAVKLGRMMNVEYALFGSLTKLGTNYTLNIRVVKIIDATIILDIKEYFTNEDVLPELIEKIAKSVNGIKEVKGKKIPQAIKLEKVLVLLPVISIDETYARNFFDQLCIVLPSYKKYYASEQTVVFNLYEKFNKKKFEEISLDEIKEMMSLSESKYALYTKIYKEEDKNKVEVVLYKDKEGIVDFSKNFITRYDEALTKLAERISELISKEKDKRITDELIDFDKEAFDIQITKHKEVQKALYISGSIIAGVGGVTLLTAGVLTGVYGYRFYLMSTSKALLESWQYNKINNYLLTSFVVLYSLGSVVTIAGICIDLVAYYTFGEKIKEFEEGKKRLSFRPLIELGVAKVNLGVEMKF